MKFPRLLLCSLLSLIACQAFVSCSSEPKRKERVPPRADVSTLPWNRPPKWEGSSRYGQMMPQSR